MESQSLVVYLDCNATTPIEPSVKDEMLRFMSEEYGNAGSRTHEYGARAKKAVEQARELVAEVVKAKKDEVIFTSGATESNNLAILGLKKHGQEQKKRHIVSTQIEHKAVLEPLEFLVEEGFDVDLVPPNSGGWVPPEAIQECMRDDTLLVSVMHVNNETGVIQPIQEIARLLEEHPAFLHVDAAQGFGKDIEPLQDERIDLISISGHKIYGPKGIGALVLRRRGFKRPPLNPLFFGGGQERGLRPGTLPVHLIVGLGVAAELGLKNTNRRKEKCLEFRQTALQALSKFSPGFNGDQDRVMPHVLNLSVAGIDSEAVMVAFKNEIAISNGSACTSQNYSPSHVLKAMGLDDAVIEGALRISWCHMTPQPNWEAVTQRLAQLSSS